MVRAIPVEFNGHSESIMSSQAPRVPLVTQRITARQLQRLETLKLHYDISQSAIICMRCGFALKNDGDRVGRHLGERHSIPKSDRRNINKFIQSLRLADPDTLIPRPDGSIPHPHLALQRGSACKDCKLRSGSYEVLSNHLMKSHRQEISKIGAKGKHWLRDHIEENLTFQSWKANDMLRSWIVSTDDQQTRQGSLRSNLFFQATPDSIRDFAQELPSEERELLSKQLNVSHASVSASFCPTLPAPVRKEKAFVAVKSHKRLKLRHEALATDPPAVDLLDQFLETDVIRLGEDETFDAIRYWNDRYYTQPDLAHIIEASECLRSWFGPPAQNTFEDIIGRLEGESDLQGARHGGEGSEIRMGNEDLQAVEQEGVLDEDNTTQAGLR
ncbi:hypothetical protein FOVG_18501 [Fusarium oxysporum f. sp. pisi HDV247]|uniref:Uncharacterized protein n=1 Tax=Fusarium oxysporum f. sp. pisi HDV247 TaxID=1080344 RepID=W9NBC8_FUSOX|nr:hypothetical protein FOVG_18501 [Fusarium oxysporum f. sp. pisi HDV247]